MRSVVGVSVKIPVTDICLDKVQTDLVIRDERDSDYGVRKDMVCFRREGDYIVVPKAYGLRHIKKEGLPYVDRSFPGKTIDVSFSGKLRESQKPVVEDAMDVLESEQGAVLNLFCGFGKTTCANNISCRLGLRTLILVHTSALVEQWRDRIEQFVDNSSVGLIRQDTFDVSGRTHVIGLMQSISKRKYPENAFSSFGLLVIDECHHVCADQLSKCIEVAGARYRLGLSATPFRKDGYHRFLWDAIGRVAVTVTRGEKTQELLVEAVLVDNYVSETHTVRRAGGKTSMNLSRMVTDLTESTERTSSLARCIRSKFLEGRHVIVLSDRREHLRTLYRTLKNMGEIDVGFIVGGQNLFRVKDKSKPNIKADESERRVILSTYAFCSEGLDIPSLDTVVFATPRSDIVQTTGRILRSHEFKKTPLVVDFVDTHAVFMNQFRKRMKYLETLGARTTYFDGALNPSSWNRRKIKSEDKPKTRLCNKFGFDKSLF